jgi:hypothetical protein
LLNCVTSLLALSRDCFKRLRKKFSSKVISRCGTAVETVHAG